MASLHIRITELVPPDQIQLEQERSLLASSCAEQQNGFSHLSTVSRKPTILLELLFMLPDLFPCNRHKNQGHTKATQVHSNRAETHDLFLKQKLAILIRFELYFDK